MTGFDYVAVDRSGRRTQGALDADDEAAARARLVRKGLAILSLAPSADIADRAQDRRPIIARPRMSSRQLALTTRQLATLITVIPLEQALATLALQVEQPGARAILRGVHASVLEGRRLSEAMSAQGRAFPPLYRAMVAAGERSGALPAILERLADHLERQQQVRGKVMAALIYPAVLSLVAIAVVTGLMVFVVPRIVEQFEGMNQSLPLLTRMVIAGSDLLRGWGWLLALMLGIGVMGMIAALKHEPARLRIDELILKTPIVGRLVRDLNGAAMARTLSIMLAGGLPMLEGLQITARTVGNRALRVATSGMADTIREGGSLSGAMRRAGVFPPILVHMAASGEASGRLESLLDRAADYLERQFNAFTAVALSLLEPIVIVVMGVVVAVIVLSILLPILQINTLAAR